MRKASTRNIRTRNIFIGILLIVAMATLVLLTGCGQTEQSGTDTAGQSIAAGTGQPGAAGAGDNAADAGGAAEVRSAVLTALTAQEQAVEVLPPALEDRDRAQRQAEVTRLQNAQKAVSPEDFAGSRPELLLTKCRSTYKGVSLQWRDVPGSTGYQVVRADTIDGDYELFAETAETTLKAEADGDGFYKVRALQGETASRWSLTLQMPCVSGYVEKMYYDKKGFTHFRVSVSNRTDQALWFYGQGLYDAATDPRYSIEKYDIETYEKVGTPYPLTAAISAEPGRSVLVPAGAEGQTIDVYLPQRLVWLGESGMHQELPAAEETAAGASTGASGSGSSASGNGGAAVTGSSGTSKSTRVNVTDRYYGYRVCMTFYPEGDEPAFVLNATEQETASKTPARIAH